MKKFDLEKDVPHIHNVKELKEWLRPLYIIEDYLVDEDTYKSFMKKTLNILRGCYTIYKCRTYPIHFKFNKNDKKEHVLELRHFYVNIILWYPFVELSGLNVLNEDFILDCNNDTAKIEDYINYWKSNKSSDKEVKNPTEYLSD